MVTVLDPRSAEYETSKIKSADAYRHFKQFAVAEGYRENSIAAINSFVQRLRARCPAISVKQNKCRQLPDGHPDIRFRSADVVRSDWRVKRL